MMDDTVHLCQRAYHGTGNIPACEVSAALRVRVTVTCALLNYYGQRPAVKADSRIEERGTGNRTMRRNGYVPWETMTNDDDMI